MVSSLPCRRVTKRCPCKRSTFNKPNSVSLQAWSQQLPRRLMEQYASSAHQALLKKHGLVGSMSRKSNCWDNAVMERFFLNLKMERVWQKDYANHSEATNDRRSTLTAATECASRILKQLPTPLGDLVGVQLEVLGQLCRGLVFSQGGQGHLGLERRRVCAAGAPR